MIRTRLSVRRAQCECDEMAEYRITIFIIIWSLFSSSVWIVNRAMNKWLNLAEFNIRCDTSTNKFVIYDSFTCSYPQRDRHWWSGFEVNGIDSRIRICLRTRMCARTQILSLFKAKHTTHISLDSEYSQSTPSYVNEPQWILLSSGKHVCVCVAFEQQPEPVYTNYRRHMQTLEFHNIHSLLRLAATAVTSETARHSKIVRWWI